MIVIRSLSLLGVVALSFGCGTITEFQTADTLPPGTHEIGVEANALTGLGEGSIDGALPAGSVVYRIGVEDGFEVGFRLGSQGLDVTGKWRLVDDGAVRLALAPTVGGLWVGPWAFAGARLPLIVEVPVGRHGLVFSPRVRGQYVWTDDLFGSSGRLGSLVDVGVGFGFAWRLGPTVLMPEVGLAQPLFAVNADGETVGPGDAPLFIQAGLGFRYGF